MSDYIKREDILDRTTKRNSIWNGITNACGQGLEEIVNDIPSADVAPVRHAKWLNKAMRIMCSDCGAEFNDEIVYMLNNYEPMSYCPACGAKMDGGNEW